MTKTVVNKPTTLIIFFTLLVGFGLYSILDLPIDLYPEINPPVLVLFTNYEGAGPEEVEKALSRPMESALSNVSGIKKMTSTSSTGTSQILLEFNWGTNMAEAANDVRDKLEFVKGFLPDDAGSPQVFKFDPSMIPILQLSVTGNRSSAELRELAENLIQPKLEQIDGVSQAGVSGGQERAIKIEISQNRLEAYNLTINQMVNMIRGQNVQISAGSITEGNLNYLVKTSGEFTSLEQIKNTVVGYVPGTPSPTNPVPDVAEIRIRDVADVYDGYKTETSSVLINGRPGVSISVQKQSGGNSVAVADKVKERLEKIEKDLPPGVKIGIITDLTKIIRNSLDQLLSSVITGGLLAIGILLIFLRSLKSTVIIALSIPISFIITMMLMYFFGLTLNIMTLSGLLLGLGMLVDNSIVILENIYRYREKGTKLKASAILGSQEMIMAITSSTLTTICVFAPIILFRDQLDLMGELFFALSFTIVISLVSSLAVAVLLVPVLSSKYLPISSRKHRPLKGLAKRLDDSFIYFFDSLDNGYKSILDKVLNHKWILTLTIVLLLGVSGYMSFQLGFELMPSMGEDSITIELELPIGTKLEVTKSVMDQLALLVEEKVPDYQNLQVSSGGAAFFGLGATKTNTGSLTLTLPPFEERSMTSEDIKEVLRPHFNDFPGAVFSFGSGGGDPTGNGTSPIDILVMSDDLDIAKDTALKIQSLIEDNIPEVTEPTVNLSDGLPQVEIYIDRDKAYNLGLSMFTIGQEVRANVDGITAGKYRDQGSEYDILLMTKESDRDALPDLNRIFVTNSQGQRIPLASVASYERTTGPIDISREDQRRVLHVTGGLKPGAKLNEVTEEVRVLIQQEIPQTEEFTIDFSGEFAEFQEIIGKLGVIFLISVLLVFGVMASQFESFLDPFIILFTIPLTLIGVIGLNWVTGEVLSSFTMVGMVMLTGIVVNNGIVLVDYTNLLRKRGLSLRNAIIDAAGNRLRPILMTTLTTVLGLIPMAFFGGEGSELVGPIGKTVVGGLTASTLLTLFLVPAIYEIFNRVSDKKRAKRDAKRQNREALEIQEGVCADMN